MQIIIGIVILIIVFLLTRVAIARRILRTASQVVKELEMREAFDPDSAAELPYASPQYFRIGLRDYRPKALESLIQGGTVGRTADGKYYLTERPQNNR